MASFDFHDLRQFQRGSAAIKRPREITQFSFDEQHKCHPLSGQSLRYYYPPFFKVPNSPREERIDLSKGFDQFVKRDDSVDLHLDPLLETIRQYEQQENTKLDADFVTWRGMITKILTAPFDEYGEFEMNATFFQGTIYIEENHAAKQAQNQPNNNRRQEIPQEVMEYWGYKFEALCTLPHPWAECKREEIEKRDSEIVDNNAQYCSIVRTGMGSNIIVLGGEVDAVAGVKPDNPEDAIPYIELKTSQDFYDNDRRAAGRFEKKLCRFWAQSFLLGVPTIIVGFRSKDGHLERLEEWETIKIPNFVKRQGMGMWDGNICINFAAAFLDFLKQQITDGGTWRIQRRKGDKRITMFRTSDEDSASFLYANFKEHRNQLGAGDDTVAGER